jgi:N-acetylglutamate synthase-like GNAT family acetyltransferase
MRVEDLVISNAVASDLVDILSLLTAVNLPHDGVGDHLSFLVMRDVDGRLVGCAGLECHGTVGLLRSVAIDPTVQGSGAGSVLTAAIIEYARRSNINELVLLTTTASDFFAKRFGFTETMREPYEQKLITSAEWQLPRCSSAVVMSLPLSRDTTS